MKAQINETRNLLKEIRENRTYLEDLNDLAESYHEVLEISNLKNVS